MEQQQPAAEGAQQPSDAAKVQQLLHSMGVEEFEPRVVNQLQDFLYRYVTDVLLDAELYSEHGGKEPGRVDMDDILLAIQARTKHGFAQPPTQDEVIATIEEMDINRKELPKFPASQFGLLIPPEKDNLTVPNYQLQIGEDNS